MMTPTLLLQCAAAVAYALGGACMKLSQGLTRASAAAGVYALFLVGATLQALSLKGADLGVAYVLVLGLEALAALGIALFAFGETLTPLRVVGIALVLVGTLLLG